MLLLAVAAKRSCRWCLLFVPEPTGYLFLTDSLQYKACSNKFSSWASSKNRRSFGSTSLLAWPQFIQQIMETCSNMGVLHTSSAELSWNCTGAAEAIWKWGSTSKRARRQGAQKIYEFLISKWRAIHAFFTRPLLGIRQTCPNNVSFLRRMISRIVSILFSCCLMLSLVTFWCHRMFSMFL